jgi:hypothetical protein
MRAYVFVNVKAGKAKVVSGKIAAIKGVVQADACWGTPDIVAVVDVKTSALNDLSLLKSNSPTSAHRYHITLTDPF